MKKLLLALAVACGLASPAAAVVNVTTMGNVNYTALNTDNRIQLTVAFTAARTLTLPYAAGTYIGQGLPAQGPAAAAGSLEIVDTIGAVTSAFTLTIAPQSGDTINGSTASLVIAAPGDRVILIPISGTNWFAEVIPAAFQTEQIGVPSWSAPRNFIQNGAMNINQRGGTATCGTTSGVAVTSYGPDRWGCDVNVGSGAGQLSTVTSSPSPPAGFAQSAKFVKNSGGLAQPQCVWQELTNDDSVSLAGQTVTVSAYMQALAGMDNSNVANLVIITGTNVDDGLGVLRAAAGMTASPAITPAWGGIATPLNQTFTITTSWARYSATVALASGIKEVAVGICWTPTTATGGATDGLAFTGVQLEKGAIATPFEYRSQDWENQLALRYYWSLTELASNAARHGNCLSTTTTNAFCTIPLPQAMPIVPVMAFHSTNGFAVADNTGTARNCTTLAATASASTTTLVGVTCTTGGSLTAASAGLLVDNNNSGTITFSADY